MKIKTPQYYPDRIARRIFKKESYNSRGEIKLELISYCKKRNLLTPTTHILWSEEFKGMEGCFIWPTIKGEVQTVGGRISGHHIWKIIKAHFKVKYA